MLISLCLQYTYKMLKLLKYLLLTVVMLLLLALIIPYFLPVSEGEIETEFKPYNNSYFKKIDHVNIHYRLWKPENVKGKVLLLHGFAGSTYTWRHTAQYLYDNGFMVLAADMAPFGYSEKRKDIDFSFQKQAQRLWELCLKTDSAGKWSFIGHSMGAQTAGMMAAIMPQKTDKLVFADGFFSNNMVPSDNQLLSKISQLAPVMQLAEATGKNYFYNKEKFTELLQSAYGQTPDTADVNAYLKPFRYKYLASCILASMAQINTTPKSFADVKAPTLVIWGTKDTWIPLEKAEQFTESYPVIKLYKIENAGHCPMETHAKEFNSIVLNFLN